MALWIPLVVGTWSDSVRSRFGGRLPFVLAGVPIVVVGLTLMAFVQSLIALALAAGLFFGPTSSPTGPTGRCIPTSSSGR